MFTRFSYLLIIFRVRLSTVDDDDSQLTKQTPKPLAMLFEVIVHIMHCVRRWDDIECVCARAQSNQNKVNSPPELLQQPTAFDSIFDWVSRLEEEKPCTEYDAYLWYVGCGSFWVGSYNKYTFLKYQVLSVSLPRQWVHRLSNKFCHNFGAYQRHSYVKHWLRA